MAKRCFPAGIASAAAAARRSPVTGKMQDRDNGLAGLLARNPLDSQRDDLAGAPLPVFLRFLLDIPHHQPSLPLRLILDPGNEPGTGLVGGQSRHSLEDLAALLTAAAHLP